ncbi:hypothetical protein IV203_038725 [Nitzschia inconspicua]|uniref:Uncharacterized protein n=1 Tax=Nitzschia inconspicua TaxID=303405 RepID=A0A9K3LRX0_9STRA|nr:hypothetical protein IV203_038725 [Nitzschia inconspicua]
MDYHAPNTLWIPLGILDDEVAEEVTNHVDVERDSQIFAESKVPWTASLQTSLPLLSSFWTYKADVCGPIKFDDLPSWQEEELEHKGLRGQVG